MTELLDKLSEIFVEMMEAEEMYTATGVREFAVKANKKAREFHELWLEIYGFPFDPTITDEDFEE